LAEAFPENMIPMQAEVREFRGSKERRRCGEFTGRCLGKYEVRVVCRARIKANSALCMNAISHQVSYEAGDCPEYSCISITIKPIPAPISVRRFLPLYS
jgi:hypothetical protein